MQLSLILDKFHLFHNELGESEELDFVIKNACTIFYEDQAWLLVVTWGTSWMFFLSVVV